MLLGHFAYRNFFLQFVYVANHIFLNHIIIKLHALQQLILLI